MQFITNIIGAGGAQHFITMMIFALVGATINLLTNVSKRDKLSASTPMDFSLKFMLLDNWKRMVSSLLLIYLFIRFMPLLIPSGVYETIDGDVEFIIAIAIGYSFDKLSELLKDKAKFLSVNREAINDESKREIY
jgi:hypothetical protein